ncbi:hypothetical protein L3X38_009519 [Prunus dulcis]|uniref:Uncharacterized protein n=1 Tax=Prunus dulcis TaxID=3755 RepID=A0AAD4WFD2_PRUDU|nr:hypothetical protein L3X38_009519 [Prunus dulcis]
MGGDGGRGLEIAGVSRMRNDACSLDVCLWKERKKMEAWVALTDFQQLDESFVRLLGGLTDEIKGSNGRTRLEIEGFQSGCLPSICSCLFSFVGKKVAPFIGAENLNFVKPSSHLFLHFPFNPIW